jgi:hypothetical protein
MAFQAVVNCAEVVLRGLALTKPIANVIGFKFGSYPVQADLQALADTVDAWVGTDYLPLVSNQTTYLVTHVRGLTFENDQEAFAATATGPGTQSGSAMPANATLCMTLRSGFTGRSARGRFYSWPFSSSVLVDAQTVLSTYGTAMASALNHLKTLAAVDAWQMVIISRFALGVQRPAGVTFPVTAIESRNTLVDSQRGRLAPGH